MTHPLARSISVGVGLSWLLASALLLICVLANREFVDTPGLALLLFGALPGALGGLVGLILGSLSFSRRRGAPPPLPRPGSRSPGKMLMGLGFAALFLLSLSGYLAPRPTLHTRTLIYGVDGATWTLLDPFIKTGELPHFQKLATEGAQVVLKSMEPVISPVVWTNIGTGFPRETHGISGFHTRADECQRPRLWNMFAQKGEVVGTYKWLVSWPPEELKGFQIPAWLAIGPETTPPDISFVKEFELGNRQRHSKRGQNASGISQQAGFVTQGIAHGLRLSTVAHAVGFILKGKVTKISEDEAFFNMNLIRCEIDRDIYLALLDRFDPAFTTFTYYPTDTLAHRFWKYFEPKGFEVTADMVERYRDAIPQSYRQADAILGEILARIPENAHVILVSDHGFVSANGAGGYYVAGLTTTGIQSYLKGLGATVDVANVGQKLSVGIKPGSSMDAAAIREALGRLTYQGQALIKIDELDPGSATTQPLLGLSLAILDDLRDDIASGARVQIAGTDGPTLKEMVSTAENQSGVHHLDGVMMAKGPCVKKPETRLTGYNLLDVAPTTLALSKMPGAKDFPGKVASFVSCEVPPPVDSYASLAGERKFVGAADTDAAREALEEKLKAIGYVTGEEEKKAPPAPSVPAPIPSAPPPQP